MSDGMQVIIVLCIWTSLSSFCKSFSSFWIAYVYVFFFELVVIA